MSTVAACSRITIDVAPRPIDLDVSIRRPGPYPTLGRVAVDVILGTRDAVQARQELALVRRPGFPAEELIDLRPEV